MVTKLLSAFTVFWTPKPELRELIRRQVIQATLDAYETQAEAIEARHRAAAAEELAEWWKSLGEEVGLTGEGIPGHNSHIIPVNGAPNGRPPQG